MSTLKDTEPSTKDLEDSSQLEFVKRWRELASKISKIRKDNPKIVRESGYTDTYWDGSFGPMHYYEIADYPGEDLVDELIRREFRRIGSDLFGDALRPYTGPDLVEKEIIDSTGIKVEHTND